MKILITGIVASGKTTLARNLSETLEIPCFEGDCIAWGFPGEERYKRSHEEQAQIIEDINKNTDWIIEGTPRESQEIVYDYADRIIFLDTPLTIRKFRIILRFMKQKLGIEKCNYEPNMDMLKAMFRWTKEFEDDRESFEKRLNQYSDKLIQIKSPKELKGHEL